ncbi:heme o synthase [Alicyclobacillus tolerans]|uniref:heme o synthase n=1 Tax=Alicyclobacillus tolerans TaxID=90970 RepID=UPI003B7A98EC
MSMVERESPKSQLDRHVSLTYRWVDVVQAYIATTKPKIQIMLLFTAATAMIVAHHGFPRWSLFINTLLGLVLATGGSASINMWFDRDIDAVMQRTSKRPIPLGRVPAHHVLILGLLLIAGSFVYLNLAVNPLTAGLALGGAFYYAVIYTMWLKRRTPQNIVIGGGAGAFPPLVGWAGVTGHLGLAAIIMFAIIFLWTPPHFWALALYKNEDYTKAGIPMMPVVKGARKTKIQSVVYAVLLIIASVLLAWTGQVGLVYAAVAGVVGIIFLGFVLRSYFEPDASMVWAKRTFLCSLIYLPVVFVMMMLNMR